MAMAAPLVADMAGGAAASGAAGDVVASGAGAARASKVPGRAPRRAAVKQPSTKATAAPARAQQLLDAGTSRADAARIIRDEYGSTLAEAQGLLPAPAPTNSVPAPQSPSVPAPSTPSIPSVPRAVRSAASSGGGVILGAVTYVLALTYLRSGRAGVVAWLRAKFLNQAGLQPATQPAAATPGSGGASGFGMSGAAGQGVSSSGGGSW